MIRLSLCGVLVALSACSTYKETFDCPPCKGVGCASITQVNARVNQKALPALQTPVSVPAPPTDYRFWMGKHTDRDGHDHGDHWSIVGL